MQRSDQPLTRQFFEHFLRLPVSVPVPQGRPVRCELWQAGKHLAALYLASSSATEAGKSGALSALLALAGTRSCWSSTAASNAPGFRFLAGA